MPVNRWAENEYYEKLLKIDCIVICCAENGQENKIFSYSVVYVCVCVFGHVFVTECVYV